MTSKATANGDTVSKTAKSTDFVALATKFISSYKDFDARLRASGILNHLGELKNGKISDTDGYSCLITCGISGAGKSTLISRLISKLDADSFWLTITRKPRDNGLLHIDEGQVRITLGSNANATTLIPTVYQLDDKTFICDMPGFVDSSPVNDAIISILRKCLLTKIKFARLLVVVDVNKVMEGADGGGGKTATLISNYMEPLRNLVGEDAFDDCLQHSAFVVTQRELQPEGRFSDQDVSNRLRSLVFDLVRSNPAGAAFLSRLETCKTFTDHRTEDKNALRAKLKALINNDWEANKEKVALNKWKVDVLAAGGDELNIRCQMELQRILSLIDSESHAFTLLTQEMSTEQKVVAEAASKEMEVRAKIVEKIAKLEAQKADLDEMNKSLPGQLLAHQQNVEKFAKLLAVKKDQEGFIETGLAEHKVISLRIDHSLPDPKLTPMSATTYSVKLNVQVPDGEMALLVVKENGGLQALEKKLGNPQLIPESIAYIYGRKEEYVLYNGSVANRINLCKFEQNTTGNVHKITAKADEPFVVLVYSATPYLKTFEFQALRKEFNSLMAKYAKEKADLEKLIALDTKKLDQLRVLLAQVNDQLLTARSEKDDIEMKLQNHLAKVEAKASQMLDTLKGLAHSEAMVEMRQNLQLLSEIGDIFSANNIGYSWGPQIEQAERSMDVYNAMSPLQCSAVETWCEGRRSALLECIDAKQLAKRFSTSPASSFKDMNKDMYSTDSESCADNS